MGPGSIHGGSTGHPPHIAAPSLWLGGMAIVPSSGHGEVPGSPRPQASPLGLAFPSAWGLW